MRARMPLLLLALTACSDPDRGQSNADGGGGAHDSGIADVGVIPDGGNTRDPSCPASARWVTTVRGTLVDELGQPSGASKAQLCLRSETNVLNCLRPADSQADGKFQIDVPMTARCMIEATMRFVKPNQDRGVSYCELDLSSGSELIEVSEPFRLFPTQRATSLPPLGTGADVRTVAFGDGLEMDILPNSYFPGSGSYDDLSAARVPVNSPGLCFLENLPAFDGLYAFAPEGDVHGRVPLRIPNTTQLAANRPVHVFVLGGLGCEDDAMMTLPEGRWTEIETSAVSADGLTIPVTPGVLCLSWLAYRAE